MELTVENLIKMKGVSDAEEAKHTQIIKIGNDNIEDLNKRWNNSIPIIYNGERFKFEPSDYTDFSNYGVVDLLNKFVGWSLSTGKERNFQIDTFLAGIENNFKLLKTELHFIKVTNGLTDEHKTMVNSFINQYGHFAPMGFLETPEIAQIKNKLNTCCHKLQMEFLTTPDRYFDFEENSSEFSPESIKMEPVEKIEEDRFFKDSWILSISKFFKSKEVNLQ